MPDPALTPFEALSRIRLRGAPDAWIALIGQERETANALKADVPDTALARVQFLDLADTPAGSIAQKLDEISADGAVMSGLSKWSAAKWQAFDLNRAKLEGRGPIILLLSPAAYGRLARYAPHVTSFIGGSFFPSAEDIPGISRTEKQARLKRLRRRFRMTDRELVRRRKAGRLELSEPLAEWLVLKDRGDLV